MSDELYGVLLKFHREVVVPDLDRLVTDRIQTAVGSLRNEMLSQFDGVYRRFDRLENEYQALRAAVGRLETRVSSIEDRLERLETRLAGVEERLERVEGRLDGVEERLVGVEGRLDTIAERMALRAELDELKSHVARIEQRLAELDSH